MEQAIINITGLSKSYKNKIVLDSLSLQIRKGDIVALLGKNGAGKTTLLETIMDLKKAQTGSITLWNETWLTLAQHQKESIAFVSQETHGFEWMKVGVYLSYLGSFFPKWSDIYTQQLCQRWALDANTTIGKLSGGQRQILRVVQALSTQPKLLILDEPVAHLDVNKRRQFLSELIDLSIEQGTTVLFSSHIISDLERVANKVALLKDGKIDKLFDLDSLKASIGHIKITTDLSLTQLKDIPEFAHIEYWHAFTHGFSATITAPLSTSLTDISERYPLEIAHTPISLEDWYMEVSHERSV